MDLHAGLALYWWHIRQITLISRMLRVETIISIYVYLGKMFTKMSVDHTIMLENEAGGIYSLQYSFDGKFLAVGCGNGTIRVTI
jgi:hypothetical protein